MNRTLRAGTPGRTHPRRMRSSHLRSSIVRCQRCDCARSSQDAKSGQFASDVSPSLINRGRGAYDDPRLIARRFEAMVVGTIWENFPTERSTRTFVQLVDEAMDGVARQQRQLPATIEVELVDVKRRLDRLNGLAETTASTSTTSSPAPRATERGRRSLGLRRRRSGGDAVSAAHRPRRRGDQHRPRPGPADVPERA